MANNRCPRCFSEIYITGALWTDDPILTPKGEAGEDYIGFIYLNATHIKELQEIRAQQEIDVGITAPNRTTFTPVRVEGKRVYFHKKHFRELRESTEKILVATGQTKENYFNYDEEGTEYNIGDHQLDWHDIDFTTVGKKIDIKAVHIEDLRHYLTMLYIDFQERWINPIVTDFGGSEQIVTDDTTDYGVITGWNLTKGSEVSWVVTEDVGISYTRVSPDGRIPSGGWEGFNLGSSSTIYRIELKYNNATMELNASATSSNGHAHLIVGLYLDDVYIGQIRYIFVWNQVNWTYIDTSSVKWIDVSGSSNFTRNLRDDFISKFSSITPNDWDTKTRKLTIHPIVRAGEYKESPSQSWSGTTVLSLGKMYFRSSPIT